MKRLILALGVLLMMVSVALLPNFAPAKAAGPQSGSINVNSIVYGPPPATAPTIDNPANNDRFTQNLIAVSGTCLPGLTVRVFSNNVFVGSTICSGSGNYNMQINLFLDRNDLIARQYDGLNQPSPDSNLVTVYYTLPIVPPNQTVKPPTITRENQLIINYDYSVSGAHAGSQFNLPFQIIGGTGPYAISIDWGDGTSDVYTRDENGSYSMDHVFDHRGNYVVTIRVADKSGQHAYLQTLIIVTGNNDIGSKILEPLYQCKPDILWPVVAGLGLLLLIILLTYLLARQHGENVEYKELEKEGKLKKTPKPRKKK